MTAPPLSAELQQRLSLCSNLPSPPALAVRLIELARDPDVQLGDLIDLIKLDPALTTKVLRTANSALYGGRRRTENLRQALFMLGLRAVLSLALSFSLVQSLSRRPSDAAMDYSLYWRRSLLAALFSQALGERAGVAESEELFLAGLLQDVGMLALDRAVPDLYDGVRTLQRRHEALMAFERERLAVDHARVGDWLLNRWNLPERIRAAVAQSHHCPTGAESRPEGAFSACVAVSGLLADLWLNDERDAMLRHAAHLAQGRLGLDGKSLGALMVKVGEQIQAAEEMFEVALADSALTEMIFDQAREILMIQNLRSLQESSSWRQTAESWKSRVKELEEQGRRDNLTGVFNRAHLDRILEEELRRAHENDWPLSVAFADLDRFKRVNDTYGHQAGDKVLQSTAHLLVTNTRSTDIIARYGGEEFVLVLPGCNTAAAAELCNRVIDAVRATPHDLGAEKLVVTLSIGIATHNGERRFGTVEDLVRAADRALYAAKLQGRNRCAAYDQEGLQPGISG